MRLAAKIFQDPVDLLDFVNNVLGDVSKIYTILPSKDNGTHTLYYYENANPFVSGNGS